MTLPYFPGALDTVYHVDALALLAALPDASVDCVVTDPPYFGVKDDDWDNQWPSADAFIAWMGTLCQQWRRVLAPNGSLYVFASPRMAARVEVEIGKHFNVLNHLIWRKEQARHKGSDIDALRGYFPQTERIIFAEQFGTDAFAIGDTGDHFFQPIQQWMDATRNGLDTAQIAILSDLPQSQVSHYFRRDASGWRIPTQETIYALKKALPKWNKSELELRTWYDDLRREYDDLRRPFAARPDAPYTDVWDFKTVTAYDGKHPCEKPLALMSHIIQTSTRPGALILDCFAGSGATLDAARRLGRRFIGCDFDAHWAAYASKRVTLPYTLDMFAEIGVAA